MSTNFREVLRDLEARESEILQELKDIQAAKPAIQRMASAIKEPASAPASSGSYAGLGTKDAIISYLTGQSEPKSVAEITKALLDGGIRTRSTDFSGVVKSTLGALKSDGKADRKEDGWVISPSDSSGASPTGFLQPSLQ